MSYTWEGMRKIPWEEVKQIIRRQVDLAGYFFLYDDNTEALCDGTEHIMDIVDHHDRGGEFGTDMEQ